MKISQNQQILFSWKRVNWGATGCYDVNFQIPEGHNELNVHFGSQFLHAPNFGCVDVTLKLEGNKNKFLAF